MADLPININGIDTTLIDTGSGYQIDLTSFNGRQFLRAERDDLKTRKAILQEIRERTSLERDNAIAQRDDAIAQRTAAVNEIDVINTRIELIRDFLTAAGDDPDA